MARYVPNIRNVGDDAAGIADALRRAQPGVSGLDGDGVWNALGRMEEVPFFNLLRSLDNDLLFDIAKNMSDARRIDFMKGLKTNANSERLIELNNLQRRLDDIDTPTTTTTPPDTVPGPEDIGELFNAQSLPSGQRYDDASLKRWSDAFDNMDSIEKSQVTAPYRSGGRTLSPQFERLPEPIKRKFLRSDPVLRWNARRTQGPYDYVRSACKAMPVGCAIGSIGGMVGLGYATVELHDRVTDLYDKSDEVRACIATCLPNDWYSSEASGSGTLDYDELDFKDLEELKETSGNDDLTAANTPLCNANMTPEGCINMCESRCEDLNSTFLQDLTEAAGDAGRNLANEAGDVAGEGLAAFLDGIFGEDMGIPAAIAIFIFIVIVMVVVAM